MLRRGKKEIELEIGHVLFIDIVAYSTLSVTSIHAKLRNSTRLFVHPSNYGRSSGETDF